MKRVSEVIITEYVYETEKERNSHVEQMEIDGWYCEYTLDPIMENKTWYAKFTKRKES